MHRLGAAAREAAVAVAIAALSASCSAAGTYGGSSDAASGKSGERPTKDDSSKAGPSSGETETKPDETKPDETKPGEKIEQKTPQSEAPLDTDDSPPPPPANITGLYLTCSTPYGLKADTVAFDCRMERGGKMLDDDELVSGVTWKFRSPNPELVEPRIDLSPSADWHAEYVFVGRAALSPDDLRDSVVLVELAPSSSDAGEISVSYRDDCKSHKPEAASCIVNKPLVIGISMSSSWQNKSDHLLVEWDAPTAPAVGSLVVRGQPNSSVQFQPVDGQRYAAGTVYGGDIIAYIGSGTSLQDRDVVLDSQYTYVIYHHDQSFAYGPGHSVDIVRSLTGSNPPSP
jgi:hypothetical protein